MYWKGGIIIISSLLLPVIFSEKCKTPNNEEGECILLYNCMSLIDALKNHTFESIEFVRNSNCGGSSVDPKVCCGSFTDSKLTSNHQENNLLASRRFCGYQHADDYIHENEGINIDEFPWLAIVDLYSKDNNGALSICGGSLINNRYILTAAHCLLSRTHVVSGIRLGDYHVKNNSDCVTSEGFMICSNVEKYGIEEKTIHPEFNPKTGENDIALIRLDRYVQYSDYIRPICLPIPGGPSAKSGDIVKLSGFGKTLVHTKGVDIKKKVLSKLITHEECIKAYEGSRRKPTDNHICSIDILTNNEYSCAGDSGGPVMFSYKNQWQQEGLLSYGAACASGIPDVHVKVVNYIEWITKNIKP